MAAVVLAVACDDAAPDDPKLYVDAAFTPIDFETDAGSVPTRELPPFCATAHDAISTLFCRAEPPVVTSLDAVTKALFRLTPSKLLLGHSTGLGGRLVSAINPRAVLLDLHQDNFVAFTRGQQRVEVAARDEDTGRLNLYLLEFTQDCNAEPGGCTPGDLFTTAVEGGWRTLRVRDDEALKNAPEDCRRCHGGSSQSAFGPMLLMRELTTPWLHWFPSTFSTLQDDLKAAKGEEPYATGAFASDAVLLQNTIFNAQAYDGQPAQPLLFSPFISFETMEDEGFGLGSGPDGPDAGAPELTRSATWQALYDAYSSGRALAPPYHRERITDPVKLAAATEAYQAFLAGELEADELPDLSDVLPDDRQLLAEMSFAVEPDASDATLLTQGCAECHNATLDQSVSRARFDVDLTRVTQAVIERAVERLELPADDPLAMPPPGFRGMTAAQRGQLADYLRTVDRATLEPWPATGSAARDYALVLGHHFQHEGSAPENLVIGDLTGDGRMDLLSPPYIFQQQPDGSLADRVEVPGLPCCKAALVDVDEDGLVDLVTTGEGELGSNDRGVLTLLSRGDLMLSPGIASPGPTLHSLDTVRIGDIDLDGHLDLSSTGTLSTVNAYLGDGRGEFSATSIPVGDDPGAQFGPLALGDVTGDELDDLVLFDHHSSTLVIHASDGKGGFATTPAVYDVGRGVNPFAAVGSRLAIGDADGDGLDDILMGPGTVSLLLQDTDGDFAPGPVLNISGGTFAFVDVDGDGRKDVVTVDGALHVLLNGPLGFATKRPLDFAIPSTSGSVLDTLAIGDLNDDGCPDVAVARNGSVIVMHGKGCL